MACGEWNGHVSDNVTWSLKVKVVTPIFLGPLSISKTAGDTHLVTMEQLAPEGINWSRDWCRHVTSKSEGHESWPRYVWAQNLVTAGETRLLRYSETPINSSLISSQSASTTAGKPFHTLALRKSFYSYLFKCGEQITFIMITDHVGHVCVLCGWL